MNSGNTNSKKGRYDDDDDDLEEIDFNQKPQQKKLPNVPAPTTKEPQKTSTSANFTKKE